MCGGIVAGSATNKTLKKQSNFTLRICLCKDMWRRRCNTHTSCRTDLLIYSFKSHKILAEMMCCCRRGDDDILLEQSEKWISFLETKTGRERRKKEEKSQDLKRSGHRIKRLEEGKKNCNERGGLFTGGKLLLCCFCGDTRDVTTREKKRLHHVCKRFEKDCLFALREKKTKEGEKK